MVLVIGLAFAAQAMAMLLDEFRHHRRRGLPLWERVGHPLDTASVLGCLLMVLIRPYDSESIRSYAGLAIFSSVFVTKDEWIHARLCMPAERRLHGLLFALHPLTLALVAWMWPRIHPRVGAPDPVLTALFLGQLALASGFFLYQTLYWNFYEPHRRHHGLRPVRHP